MQIVEPSPYIPRWGEAPLEPQWKGFYEFKDVVHPRQPTPREILAASVGDSLQRHERRSHSDYIFPQPV